MVLWIWFFCFLEYFCVIIIGRLFEGLMFVLEILVMKFGCVVWMWLRYVKFIGCVILLMSWFKFKFLKVFVYWYFYK